MGSVDVTGDCDREGQQCGSMVARDGFAMKNRPLRRVCRYLMMGSLHLDAPVASVLIRTNSRGGKLLKMKDLCKEPPQLTQRVFLIN
jgi:hypothetical protein